MRVSVIVPVYNAGRYVRQAVESALAQPETAEVILIEDASPDDSLQVCSELAREFSRVKLLRHSDARNHGAGASRNLGIRNASSDLVAFLDADDYYLPERFSVAKQILKNHPDIDGVYEAVGTHFEDESARERWLRDNRPLLTTMTARVPPESLFELQGPIGSCGACHLNGWTVKRSVFDRSGLFDEHLRLHQDSAMWAKLAAVGRMLPGRLDEPVAMRRVHDLNRKFAPRTAREEYDNKVLMWSTLWRWSRHSLDKSKRGLVLRCFIYQAVKPYAHRHSPLTRRVQAAVQLLRLVMRYPVLLFEGLFWESIVDVGLEK